MKTLTLVFGGLITYFAYSAYRRTRIPALRALTFGFGAVTLGAFLAGAAHQAFGLDTDIVLVIESVLTAIGFGIILYSLYTT
nr:hypothetical protein [Halalkalicoccus sp. NIPERK01]